MKRQLLHIIPLLLWCLSLTLAAQTGVSSQMGIPFFKNYAASEYKAHNRNFDVLCDAQGNVFFANFEGLLVYDHVQWRILHTPGISRITDLHQDKDGKIWFEGVKVKGYVESLDGDSIRVHYTESDQGNTRAVTTRQAATQGEVDRWNDIEVYQRLQLPNGRTLLATATEGVIALDEKGHEVWRVNNANDLCSNSVTKLAFDGKGTVWGVTDNGVFSLSTATVYSHYTENEGLFGQISCMAKDQGQLLVGTFQGLYRLQGQHFQQVNGVHHACWQIAKAPSGGLYVATSDGVYEYKNGAVQQKTTQFSLSILAMGDGTYLVGETERVCRYGAGSQPKVMGDIPNVSRFQKDKEGGVWALSLTGDHYYLPKGKDQFEVRKTGPMSLLFEYQDDKGYLWRSNDNGIGLFCDEMPANLKSWVLPFSTYNVQAMLVDDGVAWMGSNSELVRFDIAKCMKVKTYAPQVYIRSFSLTDRDLSLSFSNDKVDPVGQTLYSYRLSDDDEWSKWSEQNQFLFPNMSPGRYHVSVRSKDAFGQISEAQAKAFTVPQPVYFRWYAIILYIILLALLVWAIVWWYGRYNRKKIAEQDRLIKAATADIEKQKDEILGQKNEIEAQKDEIEEKSHKLEETLGELKSAQNQLLRQEREAAIGKLTKGLIDRILNPLNYINNFSHLTLGLTKDLKEDLDDEQDNMSEDNYEDAQDVLDMMNTNLEKIEQHGLSTTKILKAMEEMLKERSLNAEPHDISLLCQQNIERFSKYYADDINKYHIQVDWQKPDYPIAADVVVDSFNKVIMSMLANAIYAIKKRAEKAPSDYAPVVRLTITPNTGEEAPSVIIYDNGIGIEESILDKIFDPFFTTKPTAEAPGVGLYLSQQSIHDIGGNIEVRSEKDKYTEFTISLP